MTSHPKPLTMIHTSDWHLGHELFGHSREVEHDAFLSWLLDTLDAELADVLLVTGDVYDVANPPVSAMKRLFGFLNRAQIRRPGLQVIIIGGNHDSAARIDLPGALLGGENVRFIGALPRCDRLPDFDRIVLPLRGADGATAAWLAAVPFCRPGDLGPGGLPELYASVIESAIDRAGDQPLVITGHLHLAEGSVSDLSERRIVVGGEEALAATLFDSRAAYVALGHLHRPQAISGDTAIRYAGSPFPLSATERDYVHSVTVVVLGDTTEVREVCIPRPVPFLLVPEHGPAPLGEVERALATLDLNAREDSAWHPFIEIQVLTDGPEPHLQQRVLAAIADKPVRLTRIVRSHVSEIGGPAIPGGNGAGLADFDPEAVFAAKYRATHGSDPPAELVAAFQQLLVDAHDDNSMVTA